MIAHWHWRAAEVCRDLALLGVVFAVAGAGVVLLVVGVLLAASWALTVVGTRRDV